MECNVYAERGRPQRSRAPGSEAPTAAAGNKAAEKKTIIRRQWHKYPTPILTNDFQWSLISQISLLYFRIQKCVCFSLVGGWPYFRPLETIFLVIMYQYNESERGGNLPTTGAAVVLVATSSSATQPALRQFSPLVGAQPRGGEAFECKLWESSRSKLLTWSTLRLRWPPQNTSLPSLHSSPYSVFCLHRRWAFCKKRRFFIDLIFKEWCHVTGGSTKKAGQKKEESSTSASTVSEPASWPAFKRRSTPQGDLFR